VHTTVGQMICAKLMLAVKSEVAKCIGRIQSSVVESFVAEVFMNLCQETLSVQFSAELAIS